MTIYFDASAAYPAPDAVKAAGVSGVVAYLSGRRPGAEWMQAKPLTRDVADSYREAGLEIVSNYQFGKGSTADWLGGEAAGVYHATLALAFHQQAGGPEGAPIYAPVDDGFGPGYAYSVDHWNTLVAPFLRGWQKVLGKERTGIYCNYRCIDWALEDGLGTYFWQHGWGKPSADQPHPQAHLLQYEIDKRQIGGVGVDLNRVLKENHGQWSAYGSDDWDAVYVQLMGPIR